MTNSTQHQWRLWLFWKHVFQRAAHASHVRFGIPSIHREANEGHLSFPKILVWRVLKWWFWGPESSMILRSVNKGKIVTSSLGSGTIIYTIPLKESAMRFFVIFRASSFGIFPERFYRQLVWPAFINLWPRISPMWICRKMGSPKWVPQYLG